MYVDVHRYVYVYEAHTPETKGEIGREKQTCMKNKNPIFKNSGCLCWEMSSFWPGLETRKHCPHTTVFIALDPKVLPVFLIQIHEAGSHPVQLSSRTLT
jgi:hypothetical protein